MTATAADLDNGVLELPEPVGLQPKWLASPASKKVLRIGRRGTKTRFAFFAALMGHGPGWDQDAPMFRGILQGLDVVWLAQTYTNLSTVLWREEIVPRMGHLPWVDLNITKHDVSVPGLGSLMLRSADREAIDSIRGIGKRLGGVIIDEAAHLDLRGALQDVIMPALLDNDAWLILMSTTNAGADGGYDDTGAPQVPSYFNTICEQIRAQQRGPDWEEFTGTAFDNPTLNPDAIRSLIAEYPPDSPKLKQEVFAELLKGGIGLALPEVCERHMVPRFAVPEHWEHFGAFDWGFGHPYAFGWFVVNGDGDVWLVDTIWGIGELPAQWLAKIGAAVPITQLRYIDAGHDLWNDLKARGETGPTLAEKATKAGWKVRKATISRVSGLGNFRSYVHWQATEHTKECAPKFRMMDTDGNRRLLAQLQSMQVDPDDFEDALKIDADAAGRGGDDGYDMVRYGLMSRPLLPKDAKVISVKQANRAVSIASHIVDGHLEPIPTTPKTVEELAARVNERRAKSHLPAPERRAKPATHLPKW